jgi:hypothetical protein
MDRMSAVPALSREPFVPRLTLYRPPVEKPRSELWRWAAEVVFVGVMLSIGFVLFPLQMVGYDLSYVPGDPLDGRFNVYVLEHGWQWLIGRAPSFWDMPIFYPQSLATAFSDNHLGTLPFYVLFRAAGLDRESSVQGWYLTLIILDYLASYLVMRQLNFSAPGAAAGTHGFVFGLPMVANCNRLQLLGLFPVPLAVFFAARVCERGRLRDWAGLALFVAWEFYCSIYLAYFLCLFLGIFFPLYFAFCRPDQSRTVLRAVVWVGTLVGLLVAVGILLEKHNNLIGWLFLAVLVPLALSPGGPRAAWRWGAELIRGLSARQRVLGALGLVLFTGSLVALFSPYALLAVRKSAPATLPETIRDNLPRWQSWLSAPPESLWSCCTFQVTDIPLFWEHHIFPGGIPVLALLATFLLPWGRRESRRLVTAGVVATVFLILFTLYYGYFSPYYRLCRLPLVGGIRVLARIVVVLAFPLALCVAYWVTALERSVSARWGSRTGALLGALVLPLVMVDHGFVVNGYYHSLKSASQDRCHRVIEQARAIDSDARLLLNVAPQPGDSVTLLFSDDVRRHIDGMIAAQEMGIPCLNGYSGYWPSGYSFRIRRWSDLKQWQATQREVVGEERWKDIAYLSNPDFAGLVIVGSLHGRRDDVCTQNHAPIPKETFRGRIELRNFPTSHPHGVPMLVPVDVSNASSVDWPALGDRTGLCRIGFRWRWQREDGSPFPAEVVEDFDWLDHDLGAGQTARQDVEIPTPFVTGRFVLEVRAFQMRGRVFDDEDTEITRYHVTILP